MAKSGSITTNEKEGRSITLSWSLSSQDVANNTSNLMITSIIIVGIDILQK